MATPHKGTLNPGKLENPKKYQGDLYKIVYRSSWEREAFLWCDANPNVKAQASEELAFPYEHPVYGRRAKYYPDLWMMMTDGTQRVIEIKPKIQTSRPEEPKRKTKKYINEVATWIVNSEKWKTAVDICKRNNMTFEIWTEETLGEMGLLKATRTRNLDEAHNQRPKMKPLAKKKPTSKRPRPKRKS